MHWVLILYIYAGAMAHGDSVALTNVSGFASLQSCQNAGKEAENLASGFTSKTAKYVCVAQQ